MNQPNALISNGTCYHGASTASSDNVIPCGNVALGVVLPCCQAGDYCLDDSFCWNKPYNTTYLAGCTDAPYLSPLCPPMGTSNQQLIGLVICNDSQGHSFSHSNPAEVLWSDCPGPTTQTALAPASSLCTCTGTMSGLLWADSRLTMVASLPTAAGESIAFADGRTPTSSAVAFTTVTASRDGRATTLVVPASMPPFASATPPAAAPSTGAAAGIAIGAAAVGLAAVGMTFAWWWRRRRHRSRRQKTTLEEAETRARGGEETRHGGRGESITSANDTDADAAACWGYKSELPAEERHVHRVELPADEVAAERPSEEAGPVSPLSADEESAPARQMSGEDGLSPVSPQLLDGAEARESTGSIAKEMGEQASGERRYGEGTRLEAIPEVVTD